jgi:CRISPR-associated protein Cmr6
MPRRPDGLLPTHAGLAHDVDAPFGRPGDDPNALRAWNEWFQHLGALATPEGYGAAYARWARGFADDQYTLPFWIEAKSRLLVGHGNPSPTGVGLTLHRTWGTPIIAGSSLKGLAASHAEIVYGPDPGGEPDPLRVPYRGILREGNRIVQGPGEVLRRIFGAPVVDGPGGDRAGAQSAVRGEIIFHDAWWVPETSPTLPLVRDVLTVHQRSYYGQRGDSKTGTWPNDYDEPNPVSFLAVAPGACFMVAITWAPAFGAPPGAGAALLQRAREHLEEALLEWGVGGKTAAGYGRFERRREGATPGSPEATVERPEWHVVKVQYNPGPPKLSAVLASHGGRTATVERQPARALLEKLGPKATEILKKKLMNVCVRANGNAWDIIDLELPEG